MEKLSGSTTLWTSSEALPVPSAAILNQTDTPVQYHKQCRLISISRTNLLRTTAVSRMENETSDG